MPAGAAEVTVARSDGSTITGELREWNDSQLVIRTSAGDQQIAFDQLVSLRNVASTPANLPAESEGVAELRDGTNLPIGSAAVNAANASLQLRLPKSTDATISARSVLEVPTAHVAAFRFRSFDGPLAAQWEEIRNLKSAGDVLVVVKRDGQSLDYVEGVVGKIGPDKIEFKVDGESESNQIDRAKVAAIVYHRGERPKPAELRFVVKSGAGLLVNANSAGLNGSELVVNTIGGTRLSLPIAAIELVDFSTGKMIYLSDIAASSQQWTPIVSIPKGLTYAAEYGMPRVDQSAFGGPLTLLLPENDDGQAGSFGPPHAYHKGLAIRSRSELVYRLPAGFNRFTAIAGIDPAARAGGNVRLAVFADDRTLLETEISGNTPPQPIDVDIAAAKRLKILVDFGQNFDTGDWLNLCDAKIVK